MVWRCTAMGACRLLAAIGLAAILSGCISGISGTADLSEVASPVAAVPQALYASSAEDEVGSLMFVPAGGGEYYLFPPEGPAAGTDVDTHPSGNLKVAFFGPVNGMYVAQTYPSGEEKGLGTEFVYYIVRIDGGTINVSTGGLDSVVAEQLFADLGVPKPDTASVSPLTDDATLNWAILKKLLLTRGNEIEFEELVMVKGVADGQMFDPAREIFIQTVSLFIAKAQTLLATGDDLIDADTDGPSVDICAVNDGEVICTYDDAADDFDWSTVPRRPWPMKTVYGVLLLVQVPEVAWVAVKYCGRGLPSDEKIVLPLPNTKTGAVDVIEITYCKGSKPPLD